VASASCGRVEVSILPSFLEGSRFSSSVPGGWIGSYSSVASLPASLRMIFEPPGWEERKSVTSQTSPYKATQQSSGALCFATREF
jgi:hypothetical protein